jgi:hypothetical protein
VVRECGTPHERIASVQKAHGRLAEERFWRLLDLARSSATGDAERARLERADALLDRFDAMRLRFGIGLGSLPE